MKDLRVPPPHVCPHQNLEFICHGHMNSTNHPDRVVIGIGIGKHMYTVSSGLGGKLCYNCDLRVLNASKYPVRNTSVPLSKYELISPLWFAAIDDQCLFMYRYMYL